MKRLFTPEWVFPEPVEVPEALCREIGGSDAFLQMLVRRGFSDPKRAKAFLDPDQYHSCPAAELPGIEKALPRILTTLQNHEKIGIWGDFDVDGQTSTAVLVAGLRHLGADVVYHIPVRGPESHGISISALEKFLQAGFHLMITCDTGISANEAVAFANSKGIDTVITDHHTLPETLPQALALIDPQFLPEHHPLRTLSGVGVAYKLVEAVFAALGRSGEEESLLDLVAIGLIADVATLIDDTRYLTQRGLRQIRENPRLALRTIFAENKIQPQDVTESVISFVVAPRLNAVGRLSDANPMIEFLLSEDPVFTATTYNQIEGLNTKRKIESDQVFKSAQAMIEAEPKLLEKPILILGHEGWHTGVVGIVAGRLTELYHRPTILFNTDGELAKGSARSVDGINIIEAISKHKDLLSSFGGHPMAAGLSLPVNQFDTLRFGLYQTVAQMAAASDYRPTLEIDLSAELKNINLDLVDEFSRFAPFGPGNPPILFSAKDLEIELVTPLGKTKEHETLMVADAAGNPFKVVWWQSSELPHPSSRFDLAFSAALSTYKGKYELQIEWQDYRECGIEEASQLKTKNQTRHISSDLRKIVNPAQELLKIVAATDACVYSEGNPPCPVPAFGRNQISSCSELVFWSIPPSLKILQSIIERARPERIVWFASLPEENDLTILLKGVGGLLKSATPENGACAFYQADMAEKCATTNEIAGAVVSWFAARGDITLKSMEENSAIYTCERHPGDAQETTRLQQQIRAMHNEVIAFREFYSSAASLDSLLTEEPKSSGRQRGQA